MDLQTWPSVGRFEKDFSPANVGPGGVRATDVFGSVKMRGKFFAAFINSLSPLAGDAPIMFWIMPDIDDAAASPDFWINANAGANAPCTVDGWRSLFAAKGTE